MKRWYRFWALERWLSIGCMCLCAVVLVVSAEASGAGDWSTWRGDATRSAYTASALPESLHLQWVRRFEKPAPAWPVSQHKIQFDASYDPVVAGERIFVSSMVSDRVTAYDTESGQELWRRYVDGPVRFAPLVWSDKVYVVSDDGMLYCLDASTGHSLWEIRGGPDSRRVLGNDRLVSVWPARGAPVLRELGDGKATLYFAAGIWPFMGIFIHAVDADSGAVIWTNSGSGAEFVVQPHDRPAFAGVAPQGYLSFGEGVLLVSGGRTVPAAYDLHTGKLLHFYVGSLAYGKAAGGYELGVAGKNFINHGCVYDLKKGTPVVNLIAYAQVQNAGVSLIGEQFVAVKKTGLDVYGTEIDLKEEFQLNRKGEEELVLKANLVLQHTVEMDWQTGGRAHFRAGDRVYLSGAEGRIAAVDVPPLPGSGLSWQGEVAGRVFTMLPGARKLFVVTEEGDLYCFGARAPASGVVRYGLKGPAENDDLSMTGPEGYALVLGLDGDSLARLQELAQHYHVIGIDADAERVESVRTFLDEEGIYGRRVHLLAGDPARTELPPYLASRIEISEAVMIGAASGKDLVQRVWRSLRPYGGMAEVRGGAGAAALVKAAHTFTPKDGQPQVSADQSHARLTRAGALPESADWTHENADVANTVVSKDQLVKLPLGMLWFGGPSNHDILPRHGHGPSPQVVGGRVFIEGPDALRAVDVYTGRLLWQRGLPGLGKFYDNTSHQPGANEIGSNYVSMPDSVYVVYEHKCLRLDSATGATISEFTLPRISSEEDSHWGYIGVYGDLLIAGSSPLLIQKGDKDTPPVVIVNAQYASSSKRLVVLNRYSGQKLWDRKADQALRHNGIIAGAGKVFCLDGISQVNLKLLERRGEQPERPARLLALEANTGKVLWETDENVQGTWLGYSEEHDILLEAGSPGKDRAKDEVRGHLAAYRGVDGKLLWRAEHPYAGRPMLHGTTIYADRGESYDLMTGAIKQTLNRLTGKPAAWSYTRNYGCNTPIAGQHMLLFRSAAAGFYDLDSDGGTGNWGGFKSGCTSNLIPADGVLSAPDYTRTCTCSYQNQCSLALVPTDDVEVWTFQSYEAVSDPLKRVGVNFGAPGDWSEPGGTLWLDYPAVGPMSHKLQFRLLDSAQNPDLQVSVEGDVQYFRHHALYMTGDARQVTASGLEGSVNVEIPLNQQDTQTYTVRLFFAEPDLGVQANERLFDVYLQGERVLRALDVFAEAHTNRQGLQKVFYGVQAGEALRIGLRQLPGSQWPPVLCGIELIKEDVYKSAKR